MTTPLHKAAFWNENTELIQLLITSGADVDAKNNDDETPLHRAECNNNNVRIIACLLNRGADAYMKDRYGNTFRDTLNDGIYMQRQLNKEQMKILQTMHERFSRKFAARLSALLQTSIKVSLTSVDQLSYSEYIFGLDNPTCFNLLRVEPIDGNIILDIRPSIIYPIIDRMLGGDDWSWTARLQCQRPARPLNEGELWLVRRLTDEFLEELKHAWENVLKLRFSVAQVERNPQLIQIVAPVEEIVYLCFEVEMSSGVRGCMSLCIPFVFFERLHKASPDDTSMNALLVRAEQKLQEVSLLLSDIRRMNKEKTSEPQL